MTDRQWIGLTVCIAVFVAAIFAGLGWLAVAAWIVAGGILFGMGR